MPDDVRPDELDPDVRRDLLSLTRETADLVARHLVVTGRLIDVDPPQALAHARAAGALAGRVAVVREAVGLAAYAAQEWAEALSELRAARRMSGSSDHLPVLADCERALGRPERALAAYDDPAVATLDQAVRVELVLVVAGARRDLGQPDAAVLLLQGPARATTARRTWAPRLWYGYADALLDAGREDDARAWFAKAAEVDQDGQTDAGERLLELEGVSFQGGSVEDSDTADAEGDDAVPEGTSAEDVGTGRPPLDADELRELVAGIAPLAPRAVEQIDPGTDREPSAESEVAMAIGSEAAAPGAEAGGAGTARPSALGTPFSATPFSAPPEPPVVPARPSSVPGVAFVAAEPDGAVDDDEDPTHGD